MATIATDDSSTQDVNDETENVNTHEDDAEALLAAAQAENTTTNEVVNEEEEEEEEEKPSRANARIQELVETVNRQQRLLETIALRQHPAKEEADPEFEDPEVAKAFNAKINKAREGFQQQLGVVAEELDATKFDRVLTREGIEEGSVEYQKVTAKLQTWREEQAAQGHYFKRADAFDLMRTKGLLTTKTKKPVKQITVVKTTPHVAIQRTTSKSNKSDSVKKSFKSLSLPDKEKALENVKF